MRFPKLPFSLDVPASTMKMPSRLVLFLLSTVLIVGCSGGGQVATVSYDSESNQSTYETKRYTVSNISGSGYGSSRSIRMRVVARCEGENCNPDTAQLVFSIDGSKQYSLSGVSGRIVADETEIQWSNAEANRGFSGLGEGEMVQVLGEFATVDVGIDQLQKMATATSLDGSIGGQSLNLGSNVQSGLQALLQKMQRAPSGSDTADLDV